MTDRIKRMKERITNVRTYPICTEKMKIVLDDFIAHEGFPIIWQRAHAQAKYLDEKTIFIQDDELIAGNFAKVPWASNPSPTCPRGRMTTSTPS